MTDEDRPLEPEANEPVITDESVEPAGYDDSAEASGGPDEVEQDSVDSLQQEVERWKDLALRTQADLENYRKRIVREKAEAIRYANLSLFESLLPVLDNFHFGLDAARNATDPQGVLLGFEMVLKQLGDFFEDQSVTPVTVEPGQPFDPNLHEAVAQEHSDAVTAGAVIRVIRQGYRMGDRLIRAANVVVSDGPKTEGDS